MSSLNRQLPHWETQYVQPAFRELSVQTPLRGPVLDIGCGAGENALYFAELGVDVTGIDLSPQAIHAAKNNARSHGLAAQFEVLDPTQAHLLNRRFRTVIDSGWFHGITDWERRRFEKGLKSVLSPGGVYYVLCFHENDRRPGEPRWVSAEDIFDTFSDGWRVESLLETRLKTREFPSGRRARLGSIRRL